MEAVNTILIIEDDIGLNELLSEKIEECGYKVASAYKGVDALKWLNSNTPFLIILDYSLPDMNGKDFITEFHKNIYSLPPFIVSTGQGDERIAVEMMKLGARDYIIKDNNFLDLIPLVVTKAGNEIKNENKLKQTENALIESNEFSNQIIQSAQEGIIVYDLDLKFKVWNPFMERLTGIPKLEIIGKSPSEIFPFLVANGIIEAVQKSFKGETSNEIDFFFDIPTRNISGWVSDTVAPLRNSSGDIIGAISTVRDITSRKIAEQELIKAKEKAEESDCLKTSFLNNVSHEFRTPMNAIMGFSNLLVTETNDLEQRELFASVIQNACSQLLEIVTNVVEISEVQANQIKSIEKDVNLQGVFNTITKEHTQEASKKDLKFIFENHLNEHQHLTKTDDYKLSKILKLLINNAIKFTYSGSVKVECRLLSENEYSFSVTDSGIGISPEMQEKIFEPFRQVETGVTRKFGGPGIGLSIAKAYVEILGGKISLQSQINSGTTIHFTIPYKNSQNVFKSSETTSESIDLSNKIVLVAEDELSNFLLIEEYLNLAHAKILHAKNGIEAIDFCRNNNSIDLVLMDIKMPTLDGYTAAQQIKMFRPELKIVAQTAYALQNEREGFKAVAFDDYVTKPFNKKTLDVLLKKYIQS